MLSYKLLSLLAVGATFIASAYAETHTIIFDNRCGFGTPTLVQGPNVLSTGQALTINGPLVNAIAYLQTGSCGFGGEGCTTVEITLSNPTSSVEISSSSSLSTAVAIQFPNSNCECSASPCSNLNTPFTCEGTNVNLNVLFCT